MLKGQKNTPETIDRMKQAKLGHSVSTKTKKKISLTLKRKGIRPPSRLGMSSPGQRRPRKDFWGEKNPRWKGGTWNYQKKFAKKRDDFTCQICGLRDVEIMEVDHAKPKCDYPDIMHLLENLITICPNCHRRKTNRELRERNLGKPNPQRKKCHV